MYGVPEWQYGALRNIGQLLAAIVLRGRGRTWAREKRESEREKEDSRTWERMRNGCLGVFSALFSIFCVLFFVSLLFSSNGFEIGARAKQKQSSAVPRAVLDAQRATTVLRTARYMVPVRGAGLAWPGLANRQLMPCSSLCAPSFGPFCETRAEQDR